MFFNFHFSRSPFILFVFTCALSFNSIISTAQNTHIKCYFNHPVNTAISTGPNAIYLNGTFDDTVAAYINRAKSTVDIAQYDFTASASSAVAKIATACNNALLRGVVVRWIYDGSSPNSGLSLLNSSIKTLGSPTTSSYGIMHNKFMIVDANATDSNTSILLTASYDWSDEQTSTDYNNMVVIQNQPIAKLYYAEFNKMWGGTGSSPNLATSVFGPFKTTSAKHIFNVNGTTVEVYFSPKDTVGVHLQNAINTANNDLFFGIYTFTDNTIANLIKTKFNSGITVRGIMDEFSVTYNAYSTLAPVLGNNLLVYNSTGIYHNKIMIIDGLTPSSDPQVFTGSFNWSTAAETMNDENAIVIHDPVVADQYYQSLCQDFANIGGAPCIAAPCAGSNSIISSNISGASYQWQIYTGNTFVNISDTSKSYAGTKSIQLQILNAPSSWYGNQYRCLVNGVYSDTTILQFINYWNGSADTNWANAVNWSCGTIPDINTDVIINNGVPNFPIVNSTEYCRSIKIDPGANCTVVTGAKLVVSH